MAAKDIKIEKIGDQYELSRPQWGEHKAHISADPGLLEKVLKHTWTYKKGEHAYLTTSIKGNDGKRHTVYLHNFVLNYLCGTEKLKKMLEPDNIIEHLDNDGLNCSYTNLHILSDSLNKAKANTIDKEQKKTFTEIPAFIADVYYAYRCHYFQMQITFNKTMIGHTVKGQTYPVESLILRYWDFYKLYIDWLRIIDFKHTHIFDVSAFRPAALFIKHSPQFELTEDEKKGAIIERDGAHYLILRTEGTDGFAFISKTAYRNLEDFLIQG